ncbi:Serine/threonine-protein kinase Nek1 [Tetrabaena socialis]|uniref:non-specific serine/threonine protein kinase n=1 Tax=Tetrabaena socialis TaxID=47790 RepID=A0A2J8AK21_9CHLO|nr:Serine/threonine-protein kinase Nek1 [Tetrabaena socialis]|eukprot:PNH12872.1 Serine/threonine-protein kinase Nek1 [Tetrabaena socialis]
MSKDQPRDRQFKVLKFVGKGSYGSVFLVQRLADGQTYALKEMDVRSMSQAEREDSANEIRLLASVSHPNVISYNEAFLDGNRLCIIMEYAGDGDIAKLIKSERRVKEGALDQECVCPMGHQPTAQG